MSDSLNICIMVRHIPVHRIGGMEIHTMDLAKGLIKKGHKVTIITSKHPEELKHETTSDGVEIYYTGDPGDWLYSEDYYRKTAKLFSDLHIRNPFDAVHSQSAGAIGLVKYRRQFGIPDVPIVATFHGFWKNDILTRIYRRDLRGYLSAARQYLRHLINARREFFIPALKKIITISDHTYKMSKKYYRKYADKFILIYNGIDTALFRPLSEEERKKNTEKFSWAEADNTFNIIATGRIVKDKGFIYLVKALKRIVPQHPEVRVIIVGDGPYKSELLKIARRYNVTDKLIMPGYIEHAKLPYILNEAHVYVSPTIVCEGLPLNCIEGMACGLPLVATKICGVTSLIKEGYNGFYMGKRDVSGLTRALKELVEDENLREKMGHNSRIMTEKKFSLEVMINNYIKVFGEVAQNG